jgi:aminopeptidase N
LGKEALNIGKKAIEDFSMHFGKYPYSQFNVVETYFGGGMEYPNLIMIGTPFYNPEMKAYLESVIAHETAHQWIPFLVGSDQNDEPWLDEGFAVYSDVLYHEWEYGKHMKNQWLITQCKVPYYFYNLSGGKESLLGGDIWSFEPMGYGILVYNKGACVLDMLRW